MTRLTSLAVCSLLLFTLGGCEASNAALDVGAELGGAEDLGPGSVVWTPRLAGQDVLVNDSSYVLGPETLAVFVGEALSVELELRQPEAFALRAGLMPENAIFTPLPAGALVEWQPTIEDVGTHDFMMLVVDADEPNLVIAQELFVVDVLPRFKFIEYGF